MWADRADTVREQGTGAIVDATLERWFTEGYRNRFDLSAVRAMFESIDDDGYANCCAVIQHMDQTAAIGEHRAPRRSSSPARRIRRRRPSTPSGSRLRSRTLASKCSTPARTWSTSSAPKR